MDRGTGHGSPHLGPLNYKVQVLGEGLVQEPACFGLGGGVQQFPGHSQEAMSVLAQI